VKIISCDFLPSTTRIFYNNRLIRWSTIYYIIPYYSIHYTQCIHLPFKPLVGLWNCNLEWNLSTNCIYLKRNFLPFHEGDTNNSCWFLLSSLSVYFALFWNWLKRGIVVVCVAACIFYFAFMAFPFLNNLDRNHLWN